MFFVCMFVVRVVFAFEFKLMAGKVLRFMISQLVSSGAVMALYRGYLQIF